MAMEHCTHEFGYLLKKHGDQDYTGRVLQIPAVIVQGRNESDVEEKITDATKHYLKFFEAEHDKARANQLDSILVSPAHGVIVKTKVFKVTC